MDPQIEALLSVQLVSVSQPEHFNVPAGQGARLVSTFRHYEISATELVHMVLSDEIITTFFVTPMNIELESICPDRKQRKHHEHLVSIDDIRRVIIGHFINALPAAKGAKKLTQKKVGKTPLPPNCSSQ